MKCGDGVLDCGRMKVSRGREPLLSFINHPATKLGGAASAIIVAFTISTVISTIPPTILASLHRCRFANSVAFSSIHKPSIMPKPTTSRLLPQDHNPEDMWCPYATPEYGTMIAPTSVPAHSNCVSTELFKLQLILWEISNNPFQSIEQIALQ